MPANENLRNEHVQVFKVDPNLVRYIFEDDQANGLRGDFCSSDCLEAEIAEIQEEQQVSVASSVAPSEQRKIDDMRPSELSLVSLSRLPYVESCGTSTMASMRVTTVGQEVDFELPKSPMVPDTDKDGAPLQVVHVNARLGQNWMKRFVLPPVRRCSVSSSDEVVVVPQEPVKRSTCSDELVVVPAEPVVVPQELVKRSTSSDELVVVPAEPVDVQQESVKHCFTSAYITSCAHNGRSYAYSDTRRGTVKINGSDSPSGTEICRLAGDTVALGLPPASPIRRSYVMRAVLHAPEDVTKSQDTPTTSGNQLITLELPTRRRPAPTPTAESNPLVVSNTLLPVLTLRSTMAQTNDAPTTSRRKPPNLSLPPILDRLRQL